jgi:hypothetical protein
VGTPRKGLRGSDVRLAKRRRDHAPVPREGLASTFHPFRTFRGLGPLIDGEIAEERRKLLGLSFARATLGTTRYKARLTTVSDERIVAIGLLTKNDVRLLGPTFDRVWPVADAPCFPELLRAIDEAEGKSREKQTSRR